MGVKFVVEEGCQISPPLVPRVAPAGQKNLKIGLCVNLIPARFSARNAAGNEPGELSQWPWS